MHSAWSRDAYRGLRFTTGLALLLFVTAQAGGPVPPQIVPQVHVCGTNSGAPVTCELHAPDEQRGADFRLESPLDTSEYGFSMAMGYLNGDDRIDLVVGAPGENRVYVYFGEITFGLTQDPGIIEPGLCAGTSGQCSLGTAADVVISAPSDWTGSRFGFSVAIAPRFAADDNQNPLVIGAPEALGGKGGAWIAPSTFWSNPPSAVTASVGAGFVRIDGLQAGGEAGYSVGIGPLLCGSSCDNDSHDAVIGARLADGGRGAVYLLPESQLVLSETSVKVSGALRQTVGDGLGEQLVVAQLDSDSAWEFVATGVGTGAGDAGNVAGRAYAFLTPPATDIEVASSGGSVAAGVACLQGLTNNDLFGFSMAAGSFLGDGTRALAVGSLFADPPPITSSSPRNNGAVFVFPALTASTTCQPATSGARTIYGARQWDEFGFAVAGGDVNDDGIDDLVATARWHDSELTAEKINEGAVYVFDGGTSGAWPSSLTCPSSDLDCVPAGVLSLVFGGDADGPPSATRSDEMGFALAVGDLNTNASPGVFADLAVSSLTHRRVYVVALRNTDGGSGLGGPAPVGDGFRDLRDQDDDDDGFLDDEDVSPLEQTRDVSVTASVAGTAGDSCDQTVTVVIRNETPALTVTNPRLRVAVPAKWLTYVPDSARFALMVANQCPSGSYQDLDQPAFPAAFTAIPVTLAEATESGSAVCVRFELTVRDTQNGAGNEQLTAEVEPLPDEGSLTDDNAVSLTVPARADVSISTAAPSLVTAGSALTYSISVNNPGPQCAKGVRVVDTLPTNVTFNSTTCPGATLNGVQLTCNLGEVAAGGLTTFTISTTVNNNATGTLTNNATVSLAAPEDPNPGPASNAATSSTTVASSADLAISQFSNVSPVVAGNPLCYTLVTSNAGPSNATTVEVVDTLPAGTTFVSANGTGWTCTPGSGSVQCTRPLLAPGPGPSVTVCINTLSDTLRSQGPSLMNQVTIDSATSDPNAANDSASLTTPVTASANLSVTATSTPVSPTPVVAGETLSYEIEVINGGPSQASDVDVVATLPSGTSLASPPTGAGWSCSGTSTVTCQRASLPANSASAITIEVLVAPDAPPSLINTISVSAATGDPVTDNNSTTITTSVIREADLTIVGMAPASVAAGTTLQYTFTARNLGPSLSSDVRVEVTLPAGVTFASASGTDWTCQLLMGSVHCVRPPLTVDVDSAFTVAVDVDPATVGSIAARATVSSFSTTDPIPGNNNATVTTGVNTVAPLSIDKSAPAQIAAGRLLTYTIAVSNAGPSTATLLQVVDTLPAGVTYVSGTGTDWTCTAPSPTVTTVTCTRSPLAPGNAPVITVQVQVPPTAASMTVLTNMACVSASGGPSICDSTMTTIVREADLRLSCSDTPDPVTAGDPLEYDCTVENLGPSVATGVRVLNTAPAGSLLGVATGTGWTCNELMSLPTDPQEVVECTLAGDLAVGPATGLTFPSVVDSKAPGLLLDVAKVFSTTDLVPGNDTVNVETTVAGEADLSIPTTAFDDSPDPVTAGQQVTYTITARNDGPSVADTVLLRQTLPAGVGFVSGVGVGWNCVADTPRAGVVSCTRPTLSALQNAPPVVIVVSVPSGATGNLNSSATITAATPDPDLSNNSRSATTTIATATGMSMTVADSPDPVEPGTTLTYTVVVSNAGPSNATGVLVVATLPDEVSFGGVVNCPVPAGAGSCSLGAIAAGASKQYQVTTTVDLTASGTLIGLFDVTAVQFPFPGLEVGEQTAIDSDGDAVGDPDDDDPLNPVVCRDVDEDGCDDCSSGTDNVADDGDDNDADGLCDLGDLDDDDDGEPDDTDNCPFTSNPDQTDTDSDGNGDACDPDDDGDNVLDGEDSAPLDPLLCRDLDLDTCDDCVSGTDDPANDGLDTDSDGLCDAGDNDLDGDGVADADDSSPLDPFLCRDLDLDTCDDCLFGTDDPANDGTDTDADGSCDDGDTEDDGDTVADVVDSDPLNPLLCRDLDLDTCDDCSSGTDAPDNDGTDTDADGACDDGDTEDDGDTVADVVDSDPLNPFLCRDLDLDTCDDCSSGTDAPANDGTDTDADGACDDGDTEDDGDTVADVDDSNPLNPFLCRDLDLDTCDDCVSGTDDATNDGIDTDTDGLCDDGDTEDDGDTVADVDDSDPLNPLLCRDLDLDTCDDCSSGTNAPANDGTDTDADGSCDDGDTEDDGDTVADALDSDPLNPLLCRDLDLDTCDDCVSGTDDPANDGADTDSDGLCDAGDNDLDGDGVADALDSDPLNPLLCRDLDLDTCDDCVSGTDDPANDGADTDSDGLCDAGDNDLDGDGVADVDDGSPLNPFLCRDLDLDTCDDCVSGTDDATNDGIDTDTDGLCDDGDTEDDGDTVADVDDSDPLNPFLCRDLDLDTCDDCVSGTADFSNDGTDTDADGSCDDGDTEDDGDTVADALDSNPLNPFLCRDLDLDTCDDCVSGTDDPANDGADTDSDGLCDAGDNDLDGDGVADALDNDPLNPLLCRDLDLDTCDDCVSGTDDATNDGIDTDTDGLCDAGDTEDDGDSVADVDDGSPLDPFLCRDLDLDTCDDCVSGTDDATNDGIDTDTDGACDDGDTEDDGDTVADVDDSDPLNPFLCRDLDLDTCDDCSSGTDAPANDGADTDADGLCDDGDPEDDGDTVADVDDSDPLNPFLCRDLDLDTCDDCVSGTDAPANDGTDSNLDGLCDTGDPDDDGDGVDDVDDGSPLNPFLCRDLDLDTCDDCVSGTADFANDGTDSDLDGLCDTGDPDDDDDGVDDVDDGSPLDPFLCRDLDLDTCDDCVSGTDDPANDGPDSDFDGICDFGRTDQDGDGVADADDSNPLDPFLCRDLDSDTCDDCSSGTAAPNNDGTDTDTDGLCDAGDPDDDGDSVNDVDDAAPLNRFACHDIDSDTCDDCVSGTADFLNDGTDSDLDTLCDAGDPDDDGDGVADADDSDPLNPFACRDLDLDTCDDCVSGTADPANDGTDSDLDGLCDTGDPDDDGDGVADTDDSDPLNPFACRDLDLDTCDDCVSGTADPANDGPDSDFDGICDLGRADQDGDGVADTDDGNPLDPFLCRDLDSDTCDDCSSGTDAPNNDGTDTDTDGLCDAGDPDDDGDSVDDVDDSAPLDLFACRDLDSDTCDDCSSGTDAPNNDGTDTDTDGRCDAGDPDDDGDTVVDGDDGNPLDPFACRDLDLDTCDDCSSGTADFANDGMDTDLDGLCNAGDLDDDGDDVADVDDAAPLDRFACHDIDSDTCDDCSSGTADFLNDGTDSDLDTLCDAGDPDDDGDSVGDVDDGSPLDPFLCRDLDLDTCDDCSSGTDDPSNDGTDGDLDGLCDAGDPTPLAVQADLSIEVIGGSTSRRLGRRTHVLKVANTGPSIAGAVVMRLVMPPGVTLVSTAGCASDPLGSPTCEIGDLSPGQLVNVTVTTVARRSASGATASEALVVSNASDPREENNRCRLDTTPVGAARSSSAASGR